MSEFQKGGGGGVVWSGCMRVPGGGSGAREMVEGEWSRVEWERVSSGGGSGASEMVPVNGKRQDRKRKQIRQKRTDINKLKANTKRIT